LTYLPAWGPEVADEYEIDISVFTRFVDTLARRYCSSNHPVLRSLIEVVAAVGIVVVNGPAARSPASPSRARPETRATWPYSPPAPGPVGDPPRLRRLADDLSRAMPC
jgi:hypothetical protein